MNKRKKAFEDFKKSPFWVNVAAGTFVLILGTLISTQFKYDWFSSIVEILRAENTFSVSNFAVLLCFSAISCIVYLAYSVGRFEGLPKNAPTNNLKIH